MKVEVYVEGGGETNALRTKCRSAFSAFFAHCGLPLHPTVVACGSRRKAFNQFAHAIEQGDEELFPMLLVDSEDAPTHPIWDFLRERDSWKRPKAATEEHVHLMVRLMETWFVIDRDNLKAYFGKGFNEKALPKWTKFEDVPKPTIEAAIEKATKKTEPKGAYGKAKDSFELLSLIDPNLIAARSPHALRLIETLREALGT